MAAKSNTEIILTTNQIRSVFVVYSRYILLFDVCFESLQQDTTRSTGTASTSSESKKRFLAGFSARAVPVGVSVSCLRYVFMV